LALINGDVPEATKLFGGGLELAKARGDKRVAAECLQGLGAVSAARGEGAQAARLLGAAEALLESISATPAAVEVRMSEQYIPQLKASLGEASFAAEWLAGRGQSSEAAIEYGLRAAAVRLAGAGV
jgi:hypothetical protein